MRKRSLSDIAIPLASAALFILLWKLATILLQLPPVVLPPPEDVFFAIFKNWKSFFFHTSITMVQAIGGFFIGSVTAFFTASLFVFSQSTRKAIYPFAIALKSTPLIALAPILVLWFGDGMLSKMVMAALLVFFPVLVNAYDGLRNIDPSLDLLLRSYSATKFQVFTKIRVPHSLPSLFSAFRIASPLSVVGSVIGEYTGSTRGIGHVINTSSYYLETAKMFAGIIYISLAGIAFFALICFIEKRILFWSKSNG